SQYPQVRLLSIILESKPYLRIILSIKATSKSVWLRYVCKHTHDTGENSSVGQSFFFFEK
ncbi:hypothetical protein SFRURICE_007569, partial [Spodoptera frugiperda]